MKEIEKLKKENNELKEKLSSSIPRRRVRRVFRQLKNILEQDIENENKKYVEVLRNFATKIEKEGPQEAGEDIRQALEHILGSYEIDDTNEFWDQVDEKIEELSKKIERM